MQDCRVACISTRRFRFSKKKRLERVPTAGVQHECTKRAAAYGLWGIWSLFGPQLFADMVDVTFALGHRFYEMLSQANDFQTIHEPQCNIVAFRYIPQELRDAPPDVIGKFQLDLRRDVIQSGEFYIVPTSANGVGALRVTIINPLTEARHLESLMETLRQHGRATLLKPATRAAKSL